MRYKPRAAKSPWDYPQPGERIVITQERKKGGKQPMPSSVPGINDMAARMNEASKSFNRLSRSVAGLKLAPISESQEMMWRRLAQMEMELAKIDKERKAREEAELAEGLEYVKRSLGMIQ